MEMFRKIHADRPLFHDDLRRLIKGPGPTRGKGSRSCATEYGRTVLPEVRQAVLKASKRSAAKLNRGPRIEMLRYYGFPEPAILDSFVKDWSMKINTRGGPRDHNEAVVFAARSLLQYPPRPRPRPSPSDTRRQSGPRPARSVVGVAAPRPPGGPAATMIRTARGSTEGRRSLTRLPAPGPIRSDICTRGSSHAPPRLVLPRPGPGPAPRVGPPHAHRAGADDLKADTDDGKKLLAEGDALADKGGTDRGRHPLQAAPSSSSCPGMRKIPFKHEVKRDVTAREDLQGRAPQGDRRGDDPRRVPGQRARA